MTLPQEESAINAKVLLVSPYRDLGIVRNFHTSQISWAYNQQVTSDPQNTRRYVAALKNVSSARQSEELQYEVAMAESQIDQIMPSIEEAYLTIGIDPNHARVLTDDHISDTYYHRQDQSDESDQRRQREALKIIGRYRNSQFLMRIAGKGTTRECKKCKNA